MHKMIQGTLQYLSHIDIHGYFLRHNLLPSLKLGLGKLKSDQR